MSKQNTPSNANSRVPRLRFKGFTGAWEQRKLGEVSKRVTRKVQPDTSPRPLTISAEFGLVDQNEYFNRRIASSTLNGYFLIEKEEFAYNRSYSNEYPFGAIKRLDMYQNGALSTLYIVFAPLPQLSQGLVSYFESSSWHRGISQVVTEGARNHGLLNVAPSDFFSIPVMLPHAHQEWEKIGSLFQAFDLLITAQERKCDLLKKKKIAYLQQIFSQKLRFKGFTGAWQQCKSRDWFEAISEKGRPELPILASTQSDGLVYRSQLSKEVHYDSEALNGYKRVRLGDFIISLRSFQGGFELSDKEGIVSPAYTVFHFKDSSLNSSGYWKTLFKTFSFIESLKTVTFGIRDGKAISFPRFWLNEAHVSRQE